MTDPLDRHLFGDDAPGSPPTGPVPGDLAAPLAGWNALRARVARDLDGVDADALVFAGLETARPDALDAADRARLDAARPALDRPALRDAVARVGRDADAFDAAWAASGLDAPRRDALHRDRHAADRPAARAPRSGAPRWIWRSVALAGVAAFAAVAAFTLLRDRGFETYAAAHAPRTVALADGSQATLAPGTTLLARVDGDGAREVRLRDGAALFDVAHDAARPFAVETENARALVLGTVFGVRTDGVTTDVALVSGAVEVGPRGGAAVRLAPGETSRVVALDAASAPAPADPAAAEAWTGRVSARDTPAREVAARLAEAYGAALTVDPALAAEPVSGRFGSAGLADAAETLARALGGRVEAEGAGLRIAPGAPAAE